jgi:hypothetical protein
MSDIRQPAAVVPQVERDPAFLDTYANQLRMNATLNDFTLVFGVNEDLGPNRFVIRDKAAVHLPPTVAKVLLAQLQAVIEAYEQAVAPIPAPSDLAAQTAQIKTVLESAFSQAVGGKPRRK